MKVLSVKDPAFKKYGKVVDNVDFTELVEALKQQEESLSASFFGKENSGEIVENTALYNNTRSVLSQIPFMPAGAKSFSTIKS